MMVFARKVWHLLVTIKDGLALLLLLLFFAVLYAALTARPSAGSVRAGALLIKLDGAVVEEPKQFDPLQQLLSQSAPTSEYRARDLVRALRTAAKDERIKAVALDLSRFTGGGQVHMQEIGQAMDVVRAAKKPVLTYALLYADDAEQLAAHASEVWVNPLGGALVLGPGGKNIYFARLLERLKIDAHIFRVGTYKSAVEPYFRNDLSPESREAATALYGALWDNWKADVAKARPKANIRLVTSDPVGWSKASGGDLAKAALAAGLVDRIGDDVAFGDRVAGIVGKDSYDKRPGGFAHSTLRAWLAGNPPETSGKSIGVVTIAGEIVDGKQGPGVAGGKRIADLIDNAQDMNLAALVVRVDSPGGSVQASEKIRAAIDRWKARGVPVVVSMANLAASGGYWVTTPASRIFAEPATITGSIGVFAVVPSFERALKDWGVSTDGVQITALSGQPDPVGGLSPEVTAMIQGNIENIYSRFIGLVGKARGKTPEQVDAMGQGRVWDGGTARQKGLVDEFGGLDEALAYAARAAKLTDGNWHAEFLGRQSEGLDALLEQLGGGDDESAGPEGDGGVAGLAAALQSQLAGQAIGQAGHLLKVRGAQAYCLECPAPAFMPASSIAEPSIFARLGQLLGLIGHPV
jgi:protease IV